MNERPTKLPFSATLVVRASTELTLTEKVVWLEDHAFDRGPEGAYVSAASVAARWGGSVAAKTVENARTNLKRWGLHDRMQRPGARNVYGWFATLPAACVPMVERPKADEVARLARKLDEHITRAREGLTLDRSDRPDDHLWTYFIRHGVGGPIKIGQAGEVQSRLVNLQIGTPERLTLLGKTKQVSENQAHTQWKHLRHSGEWFTASPELVAWISQMCAEDEPPPDSRSPTPQRGVVARIDPPPQGGIEGGAVGVGGKGGTPSSSGKSESSFPPVVRECGVLQEGVGSHEPELQDGRERETRGAPTRLDTLITAWAAKGRAS